MNPTISCSLSHCLIRHIHPPCRPSGWSLGRRRCSSSCGRRPRWCPVRHCPGMPQGGAGAQRKGRHGTPCPAHRGQATPTSMDSLVFVHHCGFGSHRCDEAGAWPKESVAALGALKYGGMVVSGSTLCTHLMSACLLAPLALESSGSSRQAIGLPALHTHAQQKPHKALRLLQLGHNTVGVRRWAPSQAGWA